MNTTHAIRVHQTGGPEVMKFEEIELSPPGKGEVQIEHRAIGVNYIDIYFRSGMYPAPLPLTPGGEGAGDIVAVGKGVNGFKVGDRVGYVAPNGGYALVRNVNAATVVKLPKSVSYDLAAGMMLKGLTAQFLLRRTFR